MRKNDVDNPKKGKQKKGKIKNSSNNKFAILKEKIVNFAKTKKGKITILSSSIFLLVLITGIITFNIMYVKVTFDTNGGDKMKSIYIKKNSVLDEKYKATKVGHVFTNWLYDNGQSILYYEEKIKDDITLIAEYNEVPEASYIDVSLDNVEKDAKIVVHSLVELKDDNIDKYFSVKDGMDNSMKLSVKSLKNEKYEITSKNGWTEGFTYHAEILSLENIEFVSVGKQEISNNSKSVFFDIYKENVTKMDYSDETKTASTSDLVSLKEKGTIKVNNSEVKTYTANIKNNEKYEVGDVILFGIDTEDGKDDEYYVVTEKNNNSFELRQATFEDVYEDMEFYYKNQIDFSQGGINYEQVANKIQDELYSNQQGLVVLTNMYIEGAYNTKPVLSTLENPSETEITKMVNASKLTSIPKDKIHVSVLPNVEENGDVGLKLTVEVSAIKLELEDKGNIEISFKIEERFNVGLLVIYDLDDEWDDWFKYTGLDLLNKFSMSFTVKLQTSDGDSVNLAQDVEEFLTNAVANGHDKYDWVNEINDNHVMENTFDYLPILEKEIFSKMFWVGPVSIELQLDGVISIGAEAAISAEYEIESFYQVGSTNGYFTDNGKNYHVYEDGKTVSWNRRGVFNSTFDLTIKGAVGVRGGVKVSASVSALGMNDLYSIGLSLEGGAYVEVTGFANLSIKTQQARETTAEFNGGIDVEIGLYVEVDFTWNCWPFGMDSVDDINLVEVTFPIYEFSTTGQTLGFDNIKDNDENNPIKVYTNEYNIFKDGDKIGLATTIQYNESTKKYEPITLEPTGFNIGYRCIEHWDDKKQSIYCNPTEDVNKYVSVNKTDRNKRGTIYISDDAPDGYKFFYNISGIIVNPITGETSESFSKDVWFQYEKPIGDGSYTVTFKIPEESSFPIYDKSMKEINFPVQHGTELEFTQIPESYQKNGIRYIFDKWDKGFDKKQVIYDGDVTYTAVFKEEPAKYTYTFDAMGGKFKNNKESLMFENVEHGSKFGTVENPTRTNYIFVGWSTEDSTTQNVTIKDGYIYDSKNNKMFGDITLYAVWKEDPNAKTATLTFDAGDGYILSSDTGGFVHKYSKTVKKNEKFYEIPIAIKEDTSDPGYYYTDETFGLQDGFVVTGSKTYKANYKRVQRSFDLFISDYVFIKKDGNITFSDEIIATNTDDRWKSGTFNQKLSIPSATVEIDGQTYTTNKYILIAENKSQKPYSISSSASTLKSKYGWSYNTAKVSMYGNNTTSIIYDPSSSINYGTIISYYYGSSGYNLKGISYIEFSAIPYFEI